MLRLITFTLVCLHLSPALGRVRWVTPGSYRLWVRAVEDFPLDEEGTTDDRWVYGRHRLRIDPTIEVDWLKVSAQFDVLTGQIFGETSSLGAAFTERRQSDPERAYDGWTTVQPRALYLDWDSPWFSLLLGQVPSRWGLGLLESDGSDAPDDDYWVRRFGGAWGGDLIDRAQLSVRPFAPFTHGRLSAVALSIGGDFVYQDEEADYLDGDYAYQAHVGLSFPGEVGAWGVRALYRDQEDADGDTLQRETISAYGHWQVPLYSLRATLKIEGEAAMRFGETTRSRPEGSPDGVSLLQLGWLSRVEIAWRCPRVAMGLEAGYASGDADFNDSTDHRFVFDPDRQVGLILFPEVLRLISLRTAELLSDPTLFGVAPKGVEQWPTDGSVANAAYLAPALTWRPRRWWITLGGVIAMAASPSFMDPYQNIKAGGTDRNHRGNEAGRLYGFEALGSVGYQLGEIAVGAEGGAFWPGDALDFDIGEGMMTKIVGRLELSW